MQWCHHPLPNAPNAFANQLQRASEDKTECLTVRWTALNHSTSSNPRSWESKPQIQIKECSGELGSMRGHSLQPKQKFYRRQNRLREISVIDKSVARTRHNCEEVDCRGVVVCGRQTDGWHRAEQWGWFQVQSSNPERSDTYHGT